MTYNATYATDDVDDIVIDGIGTAGVQVIAFMSLIVLMTLAVWVKGKTKVF